MHKHTWLIVTIASICSLSYISSSSRAPKSVNDVDVENNRVIKPSIIREVEANVRSIITFSFFGLAPANSDSVVFIGIGVLSGLFSFFTFKYSGKDILKNPLAQITIFAAISTIVPLLAIRYIANQYGHSNIIPDLLVVNSIEIISKDTIGYVAFYMFPVLNFICLVMELSTAFTLRNNYAESAGSNLRSRLYFNYGFKMIMDGFQTYFARELLLYFVSGQLEYFSNDPIMFNLNRLKNLVAGAFLVYLLLDYQTVTQRLLSRNDIKALGLNKAVTDYDLSIWGAILNFRKRQEALELAAVVLTDNKPTNVRKLDYLSTILKQSLKDSDSRLTLKRKNITALYNNGYGLGLYLQSYGLQVSLFTTNIFRIIFSTITSSTSSYLFLTSGSSVVGDYTVIDSSKVVDSIGTVSAYNRYPFALTRDIPDRVLDSFLFRGFYAFVLLSIVRFTLTELRSRSNSTETILSAVFGVLTTMLNLVIGIDQIAYDIPGTNFILLTCEKILLGLIGFLGGRDYYILIGITARNFLYPLGDLNTLLWKDLRLLVNKDQTI